MMPEAHEDRRAGSGAPQNVGERRLAVVMFTDIAGFSERANTDEERALRAASRDLGIIQDLCARHEGRVVKRTGDGCLTIFSSGVQAVECAQEIQRTFAEHERTLPAEDVLQHRIGIHLGDIYFHGGDVMGDGVNIASRVQSEAPVGGICITQALFEVVKTRLSLQTAHLGARRLRHIRDPVQIYRVFHTTERTPRGLRRSLRDPGNPRRLNPWVGLSLVLACAVVVLAGLILLRGEPSGSDRGASGAPAVTAVAGTYEAIRAEALVTRDYARVASWLAENGQAHQGAPLEDEYRKAERLSGLLSWLEKSLAAYTVATPLRLMHPVSDRGVVFQDRDGQLVIMLGDEPAVPLDLRRTQQTHMILGTMVAVLRDLWEQASSLERAELLNLMGSIQLFADESGIGQADDLRRMRALVEGPVTDVQTRAAGGTGPPPGPVGQSLAAELTRRWDRDHDGELAAAEIPAPVRQRMMEADTDGDGRLSTAELAESPPVPALRPGQRGNPRGGGNGPR